MTKEIYEIEDQDKTLDTKGVWSVEQNGSVLVFKTTRNGKAHTVKLPVGVAIQAVEALKIGAIPSVDD